MKAARSVPVLEDAPRLGDYRLEYGSQPGAQSPAVVHASPRFGPRSHTVWPFARATQAGGSAFDGSQYQEPMRMNISSSVLTPPVRVQASQSPSLAPAALSQTRSSPLHTMALPSAFLRLAQYSVWPARGGDEKHLPPTKTSGDVELRFTAAGSV